MKWIREYTRKREEGKGYHVRRTVYANDAQRNARTAYPSNYVRTTRYSLLTFIPLNLWEQLHRLANVFFVVVMVLSLTPLSPVGAAPQIMAVSCIMGFQMLKDLYEDWKRYR
eukprot:CAMPEP_0119134402 /NCGR_PEP_ID=MMETSP1310-20130426/16790_1 /TAXON_ID=464262 /ORGANISM="Genus nov. species nov., Strain RCC2339" /LENGTH=111 /DNA_ID=CAMNT_0007125193 /DNA_START=212 /DNA_END=544 /DNA_ORIENTATION=-